MAKYLRFCKRCGKFKFKVNNNLICWNCELEVAKNMFQIEETIKGLSQATNIKDMTDVLDNMKVEEECPKKDVFSNMFIPLKKEEYDDEAIIINRHQLTTEKGAINK